MNWIDRVLAGIFPFFVITGADGSPYMVRYYVLRTPWFKIQLHHILRSDEDPELHDHPWHFVSVILWSGYLETTPAGERRIRPPAIVRHRATDAHRLTLSRPAWTLVFVSGKKRAWGFHGRRGWVHHKAFFDVKFGVGKYVTQ